MDELQERRGPGRPPKYITETQSTPQEGSTVVPRSKPPRKPFGTMQLKMVWDEDPNFRYYRFNDTPGRIQQAQEAGYEHVLDRENGKPVKWVVGTAEGGGALEAYLMRTPKEWYEEDMAAQQKMVNEREAAIKRGESDRQAGDGRYVPSQGIKISHGS